MNLENNSKYQSIEKSFNILEIDNSHKEYLRIAVSQLLNCCHEVYTSGQKWGDEIEYTMVDKNLEPLIITKEIITKINPIDSYWMPEYGAWMVEGIPKIPYTNILNVEKNMIDRRKLIENLLSNNQCVYTLSTLPFLGADKDDDSINNLYSQSNYVSDNLIFPAERFRSLTKNIRDRRGKKVEINLSSNNNKFSLDAMAFGMGCCSLQITLQAKNRYHSLQLHDALSLIGPIFLSLSCSTPIINGKLIDTDGRWSIISQSTDDRMDGEIRDPRFSNIPLFLLNNGFQWNNKVFTKDESIYNTLRKLDIPESLCLLFSYSLNLPPLLMFQSHLEENEYQSNTLNSYLNTFWKSVRLKLPYNDLPSDMGWRVEFRTMDLQLTDFENAAFAVSSMLVAKALVWANIFPYSFLMDIDNDYDLAVKKNSCLKEKFSWNNTKKTICQIFDGDDEDEGLLSICNRYLDSNSISIDEKNLYKLYLDYVYQISCGNIPTTATDIRNEIESVKNNLDSNLISQEIIIKSIVNVTKRRTYFYSRLNKSILV